MGNNQKHLSLFELNSLVRDVVAATLSDNYWVEAEIASINERGGHCYMELIEKDDNTNTPLAKASARCWKSKWSVIKPYFFRETGKNITTGIKVLLNVTAQFHENYGFAWIVTDIDPTFTIGDMFAKRQKIIAQLKKEGMFDANRQLVLPLFTQRIAVISSPTAAGYGDFCNHLADNEYGYVFQTSLFEAVMQGEGVEKSVIAALEKIFSSADEYDCVVITRGGGATSDLSGFDTLELARNVVNFPIPIITAIGHDRDESVLDMISNVRVKTPTAAAAFLIDRLRNIDKHIDELKSRIAITCKNSMEREMMHVSQLASKIRSSFAVASTQHSAMLDRLFTKAANIMLVKISDEAHVIDKVKQRLSSACLMRFNNEEHRLELISRRLTAVDPTRILERGYSMTLHNGKIVTSASSVGEGDELTTRFKDGSVTSRVIK